MKTAIKNVQIITMNSHRDVYENGYVVFEGGRILEIGTMDSLLSFTGEVIDGANGILMPGMINLHTHLGMIPFRGLKDDCKDRLRKFLLPMEEKFMTADLAAASAKYAICELLLSGVTTFFDMYYFENEIAKAAEKMKIRGILGETIMEHRSFRGYSSNSQNFDSVERFIHNWKDHPLITPAIAPHGTNTCSIEALKKCRQLSGKYQIPLTIHAAEMDYEMNYFKSRYHSTPIEFLAEIGVLDEWTVAAHCIHVNKKDLELIKKADTSIAHCIGSNTKAAKGVAPVKQMLDLGIVVGLGTDGPASGNTLDLFTQFKLCANFHKNETKDRTAFPAKEVISLGTIQGARALHMDDKIGSIEVGKQADLVLLETKSVNMFPVYDPHSAVVYSGNSSNVDTVFVAGQCLVKNKRLVHCDLDEIKEQLSEEMKRVSFVSETY